MWLQNLNCILIGNAFTENRESFLYKFVCTSAGDRIIWDGGDGGAIEVMTQRVFLYQVL